MKTRRTLHLSKACILTGALVACSGNGAGGQSGAAPKLYINELQPSNKSTIADESGNFSDWVELYNAGTDDVDLDGYYVSDSKTNTTKYQIPASLVIKARGFLLLWADKTPGLGPAHLSFGLSASKGESLQLANADAKVLDSTEFPVPTAVGDSWARFPDGTGAFSWCAQPTPNAPNASGCTAAANP